MVPTQMYADHLLRTGAVKIAENEASRFTLRSGKRSWVYFDHAEMVCDSEAFVWFVDQLRAYIEARFDREKLVLVNVDSKCSSQLVGALAYALGGCRQIVTVSETTSQAEQGAQLKVRFPELRDDDQFLVIDDVLTRGYGTATRVVDMLPDRPGGTKQVDLLVGLVRGDRDEIVRALGERRIGLHALADAREILHHAQLSDEQRAGLEEEYGALR